MDREWEKVLDFHKLFGHPVSDKPVFLSDERVRVRSKWMSEEVDEFIKAGDVVEQVDSMIDLIYFALGTLVEIGIKPDAVFDIVQEANMSKIWNDGKLHYDLDGKVIKPENWVNPYDKIKKEIERCQ